MTLPSNFSRADEINLDDPGQRFGFRLHHVGVAVAKLDDAAQLLDSLFGYKVISGDIDDPIHKVTVNFLRQNAHDAAEIELIAPLTDDSPIRSILAKGSGAASHLCFETTDLDGQCST